MRAAEAENEGSEYGSHETTVHEKVGGVKDKGVEEESYRSKADCREKKTLAWGEGQGELEFAEGNAGEEGADVGERCVLEEADELGGAVTVNRAGDVVWVQQQVE